MDTSPLLVLGAFCLMVWGMKAALTLFELFCRGMVFLFDRLARWCGGEGYPGAAGLTEPRS
jgi:hypothetical protein